MPTPERAGRGARPVVVVLAVALVAALLGLGLTWRDATHEHALREAGVAAARAARTTATVLTTYDHATVEADQARARGLGTARFRRYLASVSGPTAQAVRELEVTARGHVVAAAPDVRDASHVTVLMFVDQRVTSKNVTGSRTEQIRMSLQMVRQGGRWLADAVELQDAPLG